MVLVNESGGQETVKFLLPGHGIRIHNQGTKQSLLLEGIQAYQNGYSYKDISYVHSPLVQGANITRNFLLTLIMAERRCWVTGKK